MYVQKDAPNVSDKRRLTRCWIYFEEAPSEKLNINLSFETNFTQNNFNQTIKTEYELSF